MVLIGMPKILREMISPTTDYHLCFVSFLFLCTHCNSGEGVFIQHTEYHIMHEVIFLVMRHMRP